VISIKIRNVPVMRCKNQFRAFDWEAAMAKSET
jgi:hypothetical protein